MINIARLLTCGLLLGSSVCLCQEKAGIDVQDVTKLNFFDPGISFEKRIGTLQTIYSQVFLSTSFYIDYSSALGTLSGVDVYPAITVQYRNYYNGNKRASRGRRTAMNSMNYITFISEADFYRESSYGQIKSRLMKIFGTAWGFQRNYHKRFSLDINPGIGYAFGRKTVLSGIDDYSTISYGEFTNLGQISLGFWINQQ